MLGQVYRYSAVLARPHESLSSLQFTTAVIGKSFKL